MADKNRKPIRGVLARHSSKGIPRFDVGGLNQIDVTAPMPTEAERAEYFRTHDENGNLIIPNEFAPPSIPGTGIKLNEPKAYNLPYEYSLPRLGAAGIEALMTLGSGALAYPLGAAYGIGSNLLSGKYGTAEGARLADEEAAKAAEAMTYIPRTKAGQQSVEGLGDLFEASKLPPIIPELAGLQGMRHLMPDDVRAIGGKRLELAEDIRNLKEDYLNAQSGITRDRPTLGASLQRKAQRLGDIVAERQANEREFRQNYSLFPSMAEAGKSYAVFPKGAPKRNVLKPYDIKVARSDFNPWFKNINTIIREEPDDTLSLYTQGELAELYGVNEYDVRDAWSGFYRTKAQELYPDLSKDNAIRAFNQKYQNNPSAKSNIELGWLEEFSNTNELGLPPLSVLKENQDKAMKIAQQTLPNMYASMIGQEDKDFPVKFSMEGLNIEDPAELIQRYNELPASRKSALEAARVKAGLPPEGIAQKTLNETTKNLKAIDDELAELTKTKWAMEEQWTDRANQPAPEGYKELQKRETKLTEEKKRLQKRARAMEAAPALEAFHDLSMALGAEKPSALKDLIDKQDIQFFPQLQYKKDPETGAYLLRTDEQGALKPELVTPETEDIYMPHTRWSAGFRDLMNKYIKDVQTGRTDKSPEQYYLREAQAKGKEREEKAALEAKREELTKQNYMSYVDAAPADKIFGGYAAIEFTPAMSREELGKGLSIDTDVLNHCVASGDRQNGRHIGIWDPATGKVRDGMRSEISSEMREITEDGMSVTSIRDRRTGLPVTTIKLRPSPNHKGKFNLSYVSGERNGKIDLTTNYATRDYLNSRADEINNASHDLMENADVYDLKDDDQRGRAAAKVGGGTRQENVTALQDYLAANPDTPRFATADDVRDMIRSPGTAVALRNNSLDQLLEMRDEAELEFATAMHAGEPDEVLNDLRSAIADIDSRLNSHPDTIRALAQPLQRQTIPAVPVAERAPTGEEIEEYINTMDEDDVLQALVASGMDEQEVLDWFGEDIQSVYESQELGAIVYTHLIENPDILEMMREAADDGGWEPEPPMTLPAPTPEQQVALPAPTTQSIAQEYQQLSATRTPTIESENRRTELSRQIVDELQPPAMRFTPDTPPGLVASAIMESNPDVPPAVLAELISNRIAAETMLGVRDLGSDELIQAAVDALRNRQSLRDRNESAQDLYQRINEAATIEQLDDLRMERRAGNFSTTETQMLIDAARDRSRELRSRATTENLPDAVVERLNNIENISDEALINWLGQAESNSPNTVWHRLNEEQTREAVTAIEYEIGRRGLPGTHIGVQEPLIPSWPDDVRMFLDDIGFRSTPELISYQMDLENDPRGLGLTDDQAVEAITVIEHELDRRRENGLAEGGVVRMAEGGLWEGYGAPMGESPNYYQQQEDSPVHSRHSLNYGNRKYSDADVKWHEIGTDVDLFNKYGVGATKQGSVVKMHNDKIKQSDISELRARYATDDGSQYSVVRRPLDRTWSVRRSEPRNQSSVSVDISPDYKGISYTKNFANGGAVYDHDAVSRMADELLNSMNFAKGGPVLSVGRGEKLPVSQGAGLTAKGRAKYNRATGSNLKAPAPHPKTEKDANRRKSFCARMSGMPGPMKDENGNPTRKAASLKRWNC